MLTIYQKFKKNQNKKKKHRYSAGLLKTPHAKGHVMRLRIVTPRKPNSARRPVAKVIFFKKNKVFKKNNFFQKKRVTAYIPGSGHNLRRYSNVLVRGRGPNDLPGVGYRCCRNVYDFACIYHKKRRRSIYGTKRPENEKKKVRRNLRKLFSKK